MKDEFITRVGVWGQQYLRHIRQQAKPVIYLGFSPKREQVLLRFGHKKVSPRFSAGAKKGLRRKKAAQEGGWRKNISREMQSRTRAETLRIAESTAAQHFSEKKKGNLFVLII